VVASTYLKDGSRENRSEGCPGNGEGKSSKGWAKSPFQGGWVGKKRKAEYCLSRVEGHLHPTPSPPKYQQRRLGRQSPTTFDSCVPKQTFEK